MPHRYNAMIGHPVYTNNEQRCLGVLTNLDHDGGIVWGVIDESYAVRLNGSVEVLNMSSRSTLPRQFLKLSAYEG